MPKEKKPKAEKPPKEKKSKKEKPPKEKKGGGEPAAEGEEGGKKQGGKKKLLMILLPVVVLVAAGGVFLVTRLGGGGAEAEAEAEPGTEASEVLDEAEAPDAEPEPGAEAEDAEPAAAGDGGEDAGEEAPVVLLVKRPGKVRTRPVQVVKVANSADEKVPLEIRTSMTSAEVVTYLRSMPPSALGLAGDSMNDYDIFTSEGVMLVDDLLCSEVHVYSRAGTRGTALQGTYLLSRSGTRRLYKLDPDTDTVTEIPLADVVAQAQAQVETPESLREELEQAVAEQNYERAIEIRDRLLELEGPPEEAPEPSPAAAET